ncbi:MAG TPA: RNA 2',3'-cyclic phosphodiesterase [Anaerolineales bacterium]|nr:RNA 2',3'-cyclic phosphodiesterase [Anaerolineales bacterium]
MNQIRAFIAVDLPPIIQDSLEKQTAHLRQTLGNGLVRWVPPRNLHLTLRFIGDIPPTHLDFFKQMLTKTADSHRPFDLQIGGIGSFPNLKRPRVLWVGLHAPEDLSSLQRQIETGTVQLGFEKEDKPFSPHLTIGRVRQTTTPADIAKIRTALEETQLGRIGTARIDSVHLYQSELHSEGSVYKKLFSAPLRAH